jgi:N-acetylneuraminic acid mutarotase
MQSRLPSASFSLALTTVLATLGCGPEPVAPSDGTAASGRLEASVAPAPNTWTQRARAPGAHSEFAVGAAPNAAGEWRVYIFGGQDIDLRTGDNTYIYNVATNSWSATAAFVDAAQLNGTGKIGNKLYFTGGQSIRGDGEIIHIWNKTWEYNLGTNQVVQKADMPKATAFGVSGVIGGKLYVLPGYCSGDPNDAGHCDVGHLIRQLYVYDPSTNLWATRPVAPHFHIYGAAGVIKGKLYVVGGDQQGGFLDVYDPVANRWETKTSIPRSGERLFGAVLQGKLFVLSWSHPNGKPVVLKAFSYNPVTDTWISRAAPPIAGELVKVAVNGQERLFLPGGYGPSYLYTP